MVTALSSISSSSTRKALRLVRLPDAGLSNKKKTWEGGRMADKRTVLVVEDKAAGHLSG
jgi:hypothetical protein